MTLVELLLAITLFSSLMATVGGLLQSGLQAQAKWGQAVEPYQQMERALNRMEQDLEAMQPFFGVPVTGAESQVEFARVDTRSINEAAPSPEWLRVRYRVSTDGQERALIREEFLWRQAGLPEEPFQRETLMRLSDGEFAFGRLDAQKQLIWESEWDGTKDGLPRLVRFTCTLPAIGGQPTLHLSRVIRSPSGNLPVVEQP